tara:strand:+ start:552 stop:731 length:180 start_codon:yes stop_codon:yes gene_type:complete
MNAYELADLMILFDSGRVYEHAEEIANMLRYQADYIAQLEKGLESSIALNKAQAERQGK